MRHLRSFLRDTPAYLFVLPAMVGIVAFRVWPLIYAGYVSLFDRSLLAASGNFVGLRNYVQVIGDPLLAQAAQNTAVFVTGKVVAQLALGLALAILMQQGMRFIGGVRAALLVPSVISAVIASILWTFLYDPNVGVVNGLLGSLGLPPLGLLSSRTQALPAVLVSTIWRDAGFTALIYFSGLQAIPHQLYEAAMIDGTTRFQSFLRLTLPLLRRVTLFLVVTTTITGLQLFTQIYIMTLGGPGGATRTVLYYVFEQVFIYMNLGPGLAAGLLLVLAAVALTFLEMRLSRGGEES